MRKLLVFVVVLGLVLPILTLNAEQIGISLQIGNEYATVNGEKVKLDSPPVIVNGRTMVPLRFISESIGAEISWQAETKSIHITQEKPEIIKLERFYDFVSTLFDEAEGTIDFFINIERLVEIKDIFKGKTNNDLKVRIIAICSKPYSDASKLDDELENNGCRLLWYNTEDPMYGYIIRDGADVLLIDEKLLVYMSDKDQADELIVSFDSYWNSSEVVDKPTLVELKPPEGFIKVPANPKFGISEPFYVSKYEMKIKGEDNGEKGYKESYVAECRASGTPWIGLTQVEAKKACEVLGDGYSLITNDEWMTIAHSIESNPKNWSDNETHLVGQNTAKLNVGNVCRYGNRGTGARISVGQKKPYYGEGVLSASENDELGCFGFEEFSAGSFGIVEKPELNSNGWNMYRRTHYLSNDEVIWDFSGNVWEWTDWYIEWSKDRARIDDNFDENYLEINACNTFSSKMKAEDIQSLNPDITDSSRYTGDNYYPNGEDTYGITADKYTNFNLLGRFHPTSRDRTAGVAMRGCSLMHGDSTAGIYSIAMGYGPDPDHIQCKVGFRCVWRPVK